MPDLLDDLVEGCRAAGGQTEAADEIAQLVRRAIAEPDAVIAAIDARKRAGPPNGSMAHILLNDDDLTIYQVSFPPFLWGVPHDHATWAVIGVYAGAEAFNVYEEQDGKLRRIGRQVVTAGQVVALSANFIHDIENPGGSSSGSVHVYGNRHFDHPGRRIWRSEGASSESFSPEKALEYGMSRTRERRSQLELVRRGGVKLPLDIEAL